MNRRRWKISLIAFGAIVLLIFALLTDTSAQDLNMVVKKKDIHPKLQSSLWELRKNHEKGVKSFQTFAQSRKIIIENENKVTVYLFSEPGTNINETSLQAYGAEIIKRADNVLKARVHVNLLEVIADNVDGVSFIRFPDRVIPFAVESEGVGLTGASSYHSAGYIGSGVKVAVIDLGFAGLSSAISDNELPSNVVTIDCTDSGCVSTDFSSETEKHGTAVAEIVYDMAPGSQLYLIKIGNGRLDLRDAKDYCISNGIKIINFSVGSHSTSNFYSGECYNSNDICTADDAYSNGILWVNAIGNGAEQHYEATFTDSDDNGWHDVSGKDEAIKISASEGDTISVGLTWNAWPTTDQDYDIYLFDSSSTEVASSKTVQDGTQEPFEYISYLVQADDTYHLKIKAYKTTSAHQLEVFSDYHATDPAVASSSIPNPGDASGVMAVGAIDYSNWTTGPQESFSAQGPTNDGRIKPEISGPDKVSSYTYSGIFPGTSAASPHVAGAAALILSKNSTYSVSQLWDELTSSAVDMGDSGQDNIYGYGRLDLQSIPPTTTTGSATSVTSNSATLNGTVNPRGAGTTYYFEYGTTAVPVTPLEPDPDSGSSPRFRPNPKEAQTAPSYDSTTASTSAGSGTSDVLVSVDIAELTDNSIYHFRIVATNSSGTSQGNDQIFTTSSSGDGGVDIRSGGSSGGGSGCFIATAAFGSSLGPNVQILRQFRDRFLIDNGFGNSFMRFYYSYSPPIADFIANYNSLRSMVRALLLPAIGMGWFALRFGLASTMLVISFFGIGVIGLTVFLIRNRRPRRIVHN